jgi:hypothetical protein
MGPLAGSTIPATSNATGSGGGHGGMGSLGCGVYRWDSNYHTCACLFLLFFSTVRFIYDSSLNP